MNVVRTRVRVMAITEMMVIVEVMVEMMMIVEVMMMVEVMVREMAIMTMTTAADGDPQVTTHCARTFEGRLRQTEREVIVHSHPVG